jgi:hypothetical protein
MAIALRVDPSAIVEARDDVDNRMLIVRVSPDKPFVYYSGSAWSLGAGGFNTREKWQAYAAAERLDFTVPKATGRR